jgi:hypothetical protein
MMAAGVEMLIEMEVEAPPIARSEIEEEIQEGRRIVSMRWRAAHHISTRIEGRLQPGTGSTQVPHRGHGEERHNLQPQTVVPPLAQLEQGLHTAQANRWLHIGMRADHDGAARQARCHRALGALQDLLTSHPVCGVGAEGRDGPGERPGGIGYLAPREHLVEMLMRIDEPWGDEPPRQIDHRHIARHGRRRGQCGDAPIGANHEIETRRARGTRLQDSTTMQHERLRSHAFSFPRVRQ